MAWRLAGICRKCPVLHHAWGADGGSLLRLQVLRYLHSFAVLFDLLGMVQVGQAAQQFGLFRGVVASRGKVLCVLWRVGDGLLHSLSLLLPCAVQLNTRVVSITPVPSVQPSSSPVQSVVNVQPLLPSAHPTGCQWEVLTATETGHGQAQQQTHLFDAGMAVRLCG